MSWNTYKGLEVPSSSTGDAGLYLTSNFEALADRTTGTQGSVMFIGATTYASQDNANLFFDDTNIRLGIGTNSPSFPLHVYGAAPSMSFTDTVARQMKIAGPTGSNASISLSGTNAGLDFINAGSEGFTFSSNSAQRVAIAADYTTTTLAVSGSMSTALSTQTSTYSVTNNDSVILADATLGAFTVTLPTAVGCAGREYRFKKVDSSANAVTIGTSSSQTIDGASTYSLSTQYAHVQVVSDGSNWAAF
jgi:hypothetical protein